MIKGLIETKRELYHALLSADVKLLSEVEVELGYWLAKDKDIQSMLSDRLRNRHSKIAGGRGEIK